MKGADQQGPATRGADERSDLAIGEETSSSDTRGAEIASHFDAAAVDENEIPPEAADVFQAAVKAFNASPSKLKLSLSSPLGVQATAEIFAKIQDARLTHVDPLVTTWCALLGLTVENLTAGQALVSIRDYRSGDTTDHLSLILLKDGDIENLGNRGLSEIIESAAKSQMASAERQLAIETERATNLSSVLRTLSLGIQQMLRNAAQP